MLFTVLILALRIIYAKTDVEFDTIKELFFKNILTITQFVSHDTRCAM